MSPGFAHIIAAAPETKFLELSPNALEQTVEVFNRFFPNQTPLIIADTNTFKAAGERVLGRLRRGGHVSAESFVFPDPGFYAESGFVSELESKLIEEPNLGPVAVGSGTINDIAKLAAHRAGRRYMTIATAASMDGYTAFGASITHQGSKQTFPCAAPVAVIADLAIIEKAPAQLNAAGYADLLAKITSGADWILADALKVEPVNEVAWKLVQGNLRMALSDPSGIRTGKPPAVKALTEGLLMSGFAMQFAACSRPASGAEHQFSHLWDMEHHTFLGASPLHGFKVAIGTLAVTGLYEFLMEQPLETLDEKDCSAHWPEPQELEESIAKEFSDPQVARVALSESRAKYLDRQALGKQLSELRQIWPELKHRLKEQLLPPAEVKRMLREAGAPAEPGDIGISSQALRRSFRAAYYLRRRFTVLDVAVRTGLLDPALECIIGS